MKVLVAKHQIEWNGPVLIVINCSIQIGPNQHTSIQYLLSNNEYFVDITIAPFSGVRSLEDGSKKK